MSTPTIRFHEHLKKNESPYYYCSRCKKCGFIIIDHALNEGFECKLITKKLYKKLYKTVAGEAAISFLAPEPNLAK